MSHRPAPPITRPALLDRWHALAAEMRVPPGDPGDLWRGAFLAVGNDGGPWTERQAEHVLDTRLGMARRRLPAVILAETVTGRPVLAVNPYGTRLDMLPDLVARLRDDTRAARDAAIVADSHASGLTVDRTAARWGISARQLKYLRAEFVSESIGAGMAMSECLAPLARGSPERRGDRGRCHELLELRSLFDAGDGSVPTLWGPGCGLASYTATSPSIRHGSATRAARRGRNRGARLSWSFKRGRAWGHTPRPNRRRRVTNSGGPVGQNPIAQADTNAETHAGAAHGRSPLVHHERVLHIDDRLAGAHDLGSGDRPVFAGRQPHESRSRARVVDHPAR